MTTAECESDVRQLNDARLKAALQQLRQTDNLTNWLYLARTYLFLAVVIGSAIAYSINRVDWGLPAWTTVPVYLLAIVLVGAGQHQLSGLAHEGAHHILFRHRLLNEWASDWLCLFPIFGSTHHYRLQHMAHHQFVNDPERDPDVSQLKSSGHWLDFPIAKRPFLLTLAKQILWPFRLIRFMRIRARYNSVGTEANPYMKKGTRPSKVAVRIGVVYLLSMVALLTGLVQLGDPIALAVGPIPLWLAMLGIYWQLPADKFHQSRIHPVIPTRYTSMLRLTHATLVFTALAWITHLTGRWAALDYALLWVLPIFTSFAFFMILRQLVQHGNGGRGWLTNTRVFLVGRLIRWAVFPMGQDYHLPHHMYATVPHYRLPKLHALLLEYPEYRDQAVVVEGYFLPHRHPPIHPTVLDVVGPEWAPANRDVFIDNTVLEQTQVEEKDAILNEVRLSASRPQ